MPFGQIVVGPPGSGKTTYCHGMQQYFKAIGRPACIINLDPANDELPYKAAVDIADLIHLEAVMEELHLGPNGGLVYCMDFLRSNLDWLQQQLAPLEKDNMYLIIDCPGQVELFMMHDSLRQVLDTMTASWHYRLTVVHLVDAHLCTEPTKYLSALLLSLSTMLHLEQPHVNVLSKMDLIRQYGRLDFSIDFYTEVQDLTYLVRAMGNANDNFSRRHRKLSLALCEVVQDFGLLSFVPLAIQDPESVRRLLGHVDKANGFVYAALAGRSPYPPEMVYGASAPEVADSDIYLSLKEKYTDETIQERTQGRLVDHAPHQAQLSTSHPQHPDDIPTASKTAVGRHSKDSQAPPATAAATATAAAAKAPLLPAPAPGAGAVQAAASAATSASAVLAGD